MPELYIKVSVQGGRPAIQELNSLDAAYNKVGTSATKQFSESNKAASTFGGALSTIKNTALGMGAVFGVMAISEQIRGWTAEAMETQKAWANVTTLIDKSKEFTDELFEELHKLNSELGSTKDLAQGMYLALSANIPLEKSIDFMEKAAKFTKAAVTDTMTSVDLLTTVINAYGLSVEDTTDVSDKLFQMVRKGKTTGDELSRSLGVVIPTAAALGVDLKELGAAFATMTQSGISAHMATNSLNAALITFLKPQAKAVKAGKDLGIELNATTLKSMGLAKALGELAKRTEGDEALTAQLFGNIRALRAVMALTGAQAGTYTQFLKDMGNAQGLTNAAFEKQVGTLGVQLSAFWENLSKIFEKVFDKASNLVPVLQDINKAISGGIIPLNGYTAALGTFALTLGTLKLGGFVLGLTFVKDLLAGLSLVGAARSMSQLTGALGLLGGVFSGFIKFLTGPVGIALAAAAVVGFSVSSIKSSDEASTALVGDWQMLKNASAQLWGEITGNVTSNMAKIKDATKPDAPKAQSEWSKFWNDLFAKWFGQENWDQFKKDWSAYWSDFFEIRSLKESWARILTAAGNVITGTVSMVLGSVTAMIARAKGDLLGYEKACETIFAGLVKAVIGWNITEPDVQPALDAMDKLRQRGMTTGAEIQKMTDKAIDLQNSFPKTLASLAINLSKGAKESWSDWFKRIDEAETKIRNLEQVGQLLDQPAGKKKGLSEEEKKQVDALVESMKKGANPARELSENLALLGRAGKDTGEFVEAFSKQIVDAADQAKLLNTVIPPNIAALVERARAIEAQKDAAKKAIEDEKKYQDALKESTAVLNEAKTKLTSAGLTDYMPIIQQVKDYTTANALATGSVKDKAEAEKAGQEAAMKLAEALIKNKTELAALDESYKKTIPSTIAQAEAFRQLGLSMPIGSYADVEAALEKATKAMDKLGLKNKEEEIRQLEKALEDLNDPSLNTPQSYKDDAFLTIIQARVEAGQQLSEAYRKQLEDMAFSTDSILRGKALPIWIDVAEKSKDAITGKMAPEYIDQLTKMMQGTDLVLKKELLPLWEQYVASMRDEYGNLPGWLNKINDKIVKDMDKATGKLEDAWLQQVSTIFTDFSKACADIIFEAKDMTSAVTDIFKEFGKMVVRTLLEELFAPMKKLIQDLIKDLFKWLRDLGKTATDVATTAVKGASTAAAGAAGMVTEAVGAVSGQTAESTSGGGAAGTAQTGANAAGAVAGSATKGIFGIGGKAGSLIQGALLAGGMMAFTAGFKDKGAKGWIEAIGGGAAMGAAIGSMIPIIGTAIGALIGAAVGAIAKGIQALVKAFRGKNAYEAGSMEVARDYGGVQMGQDQYKKILDQMGISEPTAYPIRKEISSSPVMLQQIGELAKQQGKYQEFLKSIEATGKGNLFGKGFRAEYELGELTGDWELLDKAFSDAIATDTEFQKRVPNWREVMLLSGDAIKQTASDFEGMFKEMIKGGPISEEFIQFMEDNAEALDLGAEKSTLFKQQLEQARQAVEKWKAVKAVYEGFDQLKTSLESLAPPVATMYQRFLETGEISEELAAKITEYGGDLSKFQEVARLGQLNNRFAALCQIFRDTGEVMPELRQMFQDFGGDLAALDNAAKLPALRQSLADLDDFSSGLNEILPQLSPLQEILNGEWNKDTWQKLQDMGFDPSKFVTITDLLKYEKGWDQAVDDFYNKTVKVWDETKQKYVDKWAGLQPGGIIEQALAKYGGAEGQMALERYQKEGINTISPAMLEKLKGKIDEEFISERGNVQDYIDQMKTSTQEQITAIETAVETEFTKVGDKLWAIFDQARSEVITQLEKIEKAITDGIQVTVTNQTEPTTTPGTGTGTGTGGEEPPPDEGDYPYPGHGKRLPDENGMNGAYYGRYATMYDNNPAIPVAQDGGKVKSEGLAYVHANELILPEMATAVIERFNQIAGNLADTGKQQDFYPYFGDMINKLIVSVDPLQQRLTEIRDQLAVPIAPVAPAPLDILKFEEIKLSEEQINEIMAKLKESQVQPMLPMLPIDIAELMKNKEQEEVKLSPFMTVVSKLVDTIGQNSNTQQNDLLAILEVLRQNMPTERMIPRPEPVSPVERQLDRRMIVGGGDEREEMEQAKQSQQVLYEEHYHLEGATFYQGFDDFADRVARTWEERFNKGSFRNVQRVR